MSGTELLADKFSLRDDVNYQWRIASRPIGNVRQDNFEWHECPIPAIREGEVLLETMYLGLAPVMRMYMMGTDRTGDAKQEIGDVIRGRGIAKIVQSRHPDWSVGEIVQGQIGWQTYAVSNMAPEERFFRVTTHDLPYSLAAGVLGNGRTFGARRVF